MAGATLNVALDSATSYCYAYPSAGPILDVSTANVVLMLSPSDRHAVNDEDVAIARGLLAAVQAYADEVERVADQQVTASEGAV